MLIHPIFCIIAFVEKFALKQKHKLMIMPLVMLCLLSLVCPPPHAHLSRGGIEGIVKRQKECFFL